MDRVCHFEVPYDDKERMEKFYSEVFGWNFFAAPGEVPYSFAITTEVDETFQPKNPGGVNGGTYPRGGPAATGPVIVIEVESCEAKVAEVESAGGSIVVPVVTVGDMGIYAQVKDTEGNIIGLWQSLSK